MMTMENETIWENPRPSVTVSITDIIRIVFGPNLSLPNEDVGLTPGELALRYGDRISPYSVRLNIFCVYNGRIQIFF